MSGVGHLRALSALSMFSSSERPSRVVTALASNGASIAGAGSRDVTTRTGYVAVAARFHWQRENTR